MVYASFDVFPAPKGAATHIDAFVRGLAARFGSVDLVTVAPPEYGNGVTFECPGVRHAPLPALGSHMIERALCFRTHWRAWWSGRPATAVAHTRTIFEGFPIAMNKSAFCDRWIYEVNGLPSIELKYHFPRVADDRELLRKLLYQEQACLEAADRIVTVSEVTKQHLVARGASDKHIDVIRNGVDPEVFRWAPTPAWGDSPVRLLYCGTLAAWQGASLAIEALALCRRDFPATLTMVGPGPVRQRKTLLERADRLGVAAHVDLLPPKTQHELVQLHHSSHVALVPLLANDRNLVQGCCPLKALEAMACGTPVIMSDLPVTREIAHPDQDALLVRPGSAKAIKDAVLRLRNDAPLRCALSETARGRVQREFTWQRAQNALCGIYEELLELNN